MWCEKCNDDGRYCACNEEKIEPLPVDFPSAGSENPFCENCKETDCGVSLDGTCEMIRRYLKAVKDGVHVCSFGAENKCGVCGVLFTPPLLVSLPAKRHSIKKPALSG